MLNKSARVDVAVKQGTQQQKAANLATYADQSVQNEQTQQEVLNNSCRVNQSKSNENLNSVFNEMNKLNEQTTSQVHHMLALTKLAQHEYAEAIAHLKLATEMGYTKASFNLGLCFQNGLGVVKDQKLVGHHESIHMKNIELRKIKNLKSLVIVFV
jgi:TPR repeat protein